MNKSRINGRLPARVGMFIEKAVIETRRPFYSTKVMSKEVNIKKARITIMGEPKIENVRAGESFEIIRRKILVGLLKKVGGKCRGNHSHHMFRYYVNDLVILPVS